MGQGIVYTVRHFAALVALLIAWEPSTAIAQLRFLLPNPAGEEEIRSVVVKAPRELAIVIDDATEQLRSGQTLIALQLMQRVLDHPEDFFADETLRVGLKRKVEQLIATLPAEARVAYQLQYGTTARTLHEQIFTEGSQSAREELLSRFFQTKPGRQQAGFEARWSYDSGRPLAAGRWWNQLRVADNQPVEPRHVVQEALAWWLSERPDRVAGTFRDNPLAPGSPIVLGDRTVNIPQAGVADQVWLAALWPELVGAPSTSLAGWPAVGGDGTRNAGILNAGPVGALAWSAQMAADYSRWSEAELGESRPLEEFEQLVNGMLERMRIDDLLTQPGAYPLVVDETVLTRTPFGLEAYDLSTGVSRWRSALRATSLVGPFLAARDQSIENLAQNDDVDANEFVAGQLTQQNQLEQALGEWLLRNQTVGQMSADEHYVYAVEQVPYIDRDTQFVGMMQNEEAAAPLTNLLVAYELEGGRIAWKLGGNRRGDVDDPLSGAYFLGPPFIQGKRLFCLVEVGGELRLLQLHHSPGMLVPRVEWTQVIAAPTVSLQHSMLRRLAGLSPSAADNLLICQTAAGLVVGIDPVRRQLVWGYEYPTLEVPEILDPQRIAINRLQGRPTPDELDENESRWLDSSATVDSGYVLLTPRDSAELHCLDALTGELQWKRPRGNGLYLAGIRDGRVVVVSRDRVEAWNLLTGEAAWAEPLTIAEPSGRGLFVDDQYVLPLSTGEIARFHTGNGELRLRSRMADGRVPGHLAAAGGALVSQSLLEVVAYRPLPEIERQMTAALERNPDDAESLALRGELRLQRGEDEAGLADLRRSLSLKPSAQASLVLVDRLMGQLRLDFPNDPARIEEIERMIVDEHQRREFLYLTARGLERRQLIPQAFEQYLKLTEADHALRHPLTRINNDLTVRRDRAIRGHLQGLYDAAATDDRRIMEQGLQQRWANAGTTAQQRQYLDYFDGLPLADAMRLQMLKSSAQEPFRRQLADWMQLAESDDVQIAAYATGRLAKQALEQRLEAEARIWLDRLGHQYGQIELLPGQTGQTLITRWQDEIREVLGSAAPAWPEQLEGARKIRVPPTFNRVVAVERVGPPHPVYRDWIFEFSEASFPALIARDGAGRQQWAFMLPGSVLQNQPQFSLRRAAPRLYIAGDCFALSFGTNFVVLDVATPNGTPRFLWQRSLVPESNNPFQGTATSVSVEFLRSGRRRVRAVEPDSDLLIGQLIGVTSEQVCYQLGNRVIAADCLTGQVLWTRFGVPRQIEATTDAETVVLLDTITQEAQVLRASDGELLARRTIPDPHQWVDYRGPQFLTFTDANNSRQLQWWNLLSGEVVWSVAVEKETRCTVTNLHSTSEDSVVAVEPQGGYRILKLSDGRELASGVLPSVPHLDFVWAQPQGTGYLVVAGAFSPPDRDQQVNVYDGNQVPIVGVVARLEAGGKAPAWTVELQPTAFHFIQSPSVPVLAFAGRVTVRNAAKPLEPPQPATLSALFLDRRTGAVLHQLNQSPTPGMYQLEVDGDQGRITANFLTFGIEIQPPADKSEPANSN